MTNHFKSLRSFSPGERLSLMYAIFMRKMISSRLNVSLKTKFVIDRVLSSGGKASRDMDLICLEYKNGIEGNLKKFYIRNNTSDPIIFNEILYGNGGDYQWAERIARENNIGIRSIVDAGANIGTASVYFASQFPNASIVCIEPEAENFQLLKKNMEVNGYKDVRPYQNAFWINNDELSIGSGVRGQRERELSFSVVREETGLHVKGLTFSDCLRLLGTDRIDLLKMDIEGAEKDFVEDGDGFLFLLSHIGILAIELHAERIDPFSFVSLIEKQGFSHIQHGEILYCWRAHT